MKQILRFFPWAVALVVTALIVTALPQTEKNLAYRTVDPAQNSVCDTPIDRSKSNNEPSQNDETEPEFRCSVQTFLLDPENRNASSRYHLAFLEFRDSERSEAPCSSDTNDHSANWLAECWQRTALDKLLDRYPSRYVVAFVHGWRHNAQLQDGDVAKFKTMLAYKRRFLSQRCPDGSPCQDKEVIGVYIGWRGKQVQEWLPEGINIVNAWSSFWSRKRTSEALAEPVLHALKRVEARLTLERTSSSKDHFLVLGHSFGGNMLATAVQSRATEAAKGHTAGMLAQPLIGDLVTLINPASEARKWTSIQEAAWENVIGQPEVADGWRRPCEDLKNHPKLCNAWQSIYPQHQRPVYISYTAADSWSRQETKRARGSFVYDTATRDYFPWGQLFFLGRDRLDTTTIGHHDPNYPETAGEKWPNELSFGTTHEVILNVGPSARTIYENAVANVSVECSSDGRDWLSRIRTEKYSGFKWPKIWDSGYRGAPPKRRNQHPISRTPHVEVQWRRGIGLENMEKNTEGLAVVPPNFPYWNVRAFDTVVQDHNGYVNYPMLCALTQLVLDDITSS